MVTILELWVPIVVAAVFVFLVSSILHMVLTYHRSDFRQLPNEAATLDALRSASLPPGAYQFPYCKSTKEMGSAELKAKYERGPVGMMTLLPNGSINIGKYLAMWFVFTLLVSLFVAYLAGRTLTPGAHYLAVFRVAGCAAFLTYGLSPIVNSIWHAQPWSSTIKQVFDGLLYALVTAGAFGWLWPR